MIILQNYKFPMFINKIKATLEEKKLKSLTKKLNDQIWKQVSILFIIAWMILLKIWYNC